MVGFPVRAAAVALLCAALAGCASSSRDYGQYSGVTGAPLECVPYARARSHIDIYGDAYTWWDQAAGHYTRSSEPQQGAVMVLYGYAGPERAHLAVVRAVVDSRDIRVDHANWLDDGAVYVDDPVEDVSDANDWSQVRVYNQKAGAWGVHIYPVRGFIGPGPDTNPVPVARSGSGQDAIAALLSQDEAGAGGEN